MEPRSRAPSWPPTSCGPSRSTRGAGVICELKPLTQEAIPKALEKAERYRLLKEPAQAESICLDVLQIDPGNQQALVMLLLALTDQFEQGMAGTVTQAREVLTRLTDEYARLYYAGIIAERRAGARLQHGGRGSEFVAYEWLREAMTWYEKAEAIRPAGNDDALLVLGMRLKTPQTPPEGIEVRSVLVEEASAVERELYLSITLDRARSTHVVMASQAGGMEIEEVAAQSPEKILREWAHPSLGLADYQARRLAFGLGLAAEQFRQGVALIRNLFALYLAKDCSLAEVNPLVETRDARVLALDAKLNFDDSALYRHKEIVALRDTNEEDPLDVEASKYSLNYIKLDGNVGCMVNGAGLAMATMDIIKLAGGEPANFLDVGGGASPEQIENAFRILSSDPSVKAVFINVF